MIVLLATATAFSSILYGVSKYTHTSPDRPTASSLVLVVGALCLLYVPREFAACADTAIQDHIELSFLIVIAELGRVAYGVGFDTLAPAITAAHVASYLSTRQSCACNFLQLLAALILILGCAAVHCRRALHSHSHSQSQSHSHTTSVPAPANDNPPPTLVGPLTAPEVTQAPTLTHFLRF